MTPPEALVRTNAPLQSSFFEGRLPLGYLELPLERLIPAPGQPRLEFDADELKALAQTIKRRGILEPILCRPRPGGATGGAYEIVAGERRFRAARIAGLATVPVLARNLSDEQGSLDALIENIHRKNLSVYEEARALEKLAAQFESHAQLATELGWTRQRLHNKLRVLTLDESILGKVAERPHEFAQRKLLAACTLQEAEGVAAARRFLGLGGGNRKPVRRGPVRVDIAPTRRGGFRLSVVAAGESDVPRAIQELQAVIRQLRKSKPTRGT